MNVLKVDIVCYDTLTDDHIEHIVKKYNLKYDNSSNPEEDLYVWEGIEMSEKLYTYVVLLDEAWHVTRVDGACGEV